MGSKEAYAAIEKLVEISSIFLPISDFTARSESISAQYDIVTNMSGMHLNREYIYI
jgi:hypothetical protein